MLTCRVRTGILVHFEISWFDAPFRAELVQICTWFFSELVVDRFDSRDFLLFVGSFGALSTLLYAAPAAPLGKARNTLGGHTISVLAALAVHFSSKAAVELLGAGIPSMLEKVLIPSLAIALMVQFAVPHPPAAACVLIYATLKNEAQQGPAYLFAPALLGALYLLAVQQALAAVLRRLAAASSSAPAKGGAES